MDRRTERVTFRGGGGEELAARLEMPLGPPRAFALFAHCFTCSKDVVAATRISRGLAEVGIGVLRFDFTGLGSSEGDFANTNFSSNVDDLVAAADFLRSEHEAPRLIVGHSLGGAAVLAAASRMPESTAVATIAAPAEPAHVARHFVEAVPEIERSGGADVEIGGRRFRITRQFLDDIAATTIERAVGDLGKALLVMHAPGDTVVGIENARAIFEAARHPKSFVSLDSADHLLSDRADGSYVATMLAAWADRYLPPSPAAGRRSEEPGVVVVRETGESRLANEVVVGTHHLLADEPASVGGADFGPSPYDLVLAGLGACTSMTLRMYADRKQWPLESVTVRLTHDRVHATDCESCETHEGKLDRIDREVQLSGDLEPEQRQRLLAIAERCPVHRTLTSDSWIVTRLAE